MHLNRTISGRLVNDRAWLRVKGLVDDAQAFVTYGGDYEREIST